MTMDSGASGVVGRSKEICHTSKLVAGIHMEDILTQLNKEMAALRKCKLVQPPKGLLSSIERSNTLEGGVSTYMGAAPIVHCLEKHKSHVIITSRVADAALFLGPMDSRGSPCGFCWNFESFIGFL